MNDADRYIARTRRTSGCLSGCLWFVVFLVGCGLAWITIRALGLKYGGVR